LAKTALTMLNFLLKTRQKRVYPTRAHLQRHGKNVHLLPPTRAVAG